MPRQNHRPADPWSQWANFAESAWEHWFATTMPQPTRQRAAGLPASIRSGDAITVRADGADPSGRPMRFRRL